MRDLHYMERHLGDAHYNVHNILHYDALPRYNVHDILRYNVR